MFIKHAATETMIQEFEIKPYESFVWLRWKTPEYLPMHYVLRYSLTRESSGLAYVKSEQLPPQSDFFIIKKVRLGSSCEVNLKAVYNPAALDKGITKLIGPDDYAGKRIN